jgi:alcohol dehydrogenase (cytochrome c)
MIIKNLSRYFAGTMLVCLVTVRAASAQGLVFDGPAPSYTNAQAERAKAIYDVHCGTCHAVDLNGGQFGPPLRGETFQSNWMAKSADALFSYTRGSMPPGAGGSLSNSNYSDVFAYILQANSVAPGPTEFAASQKPVDRSGTPENRRAYFASAEPNRDAHYMDEVERRTALLNNLNPVTNAMLTKPPDEDWLLWRRTYSSHGFSPLRQFNNRNATS